MQQAKNKCTAEQEIEKTNTRVKLTSEMQLNNRNNFNSHCNYHAAKDTYFYHYFEM
jgi:hypothetical protein